MNVAVKQVPRGNCPKQGCHTGHEDPGEGRDQSTLCSAAHQPDDDSWPSPCWQQREWKGYSGNNKWVRTWYLMVSPIFLLSPNLDFKGETAEIGNRPECERYREQIQILKARDEPRKRLHTKEKRLVFICRGRQTLK